MNQTLRNHAEQIVRAAIHAVKPDEAVGRILRQFPPGNRVYVVAVGKAAWKMAEAVLTYIPQGIQGGVVVTKYGHVEYPLPGVACFEAGHPVPDANGMRGTQAALDLTANLTGEDTVLFLLSGGGSALFEKPLVPLDTLQQITRQMLACGADIVEINTIRKRLSAVKGGRFAQWCAPAKVMAIVLSDVLGDPLDMIASGLQKYGIQVGPETAALLRKETPKVLTNVTSHVIGSVRELCRAAEGVCRDLGYEPVFLTDQLNCEAREAGRFLSSILRSHQNAPKPLAFLAGGETVVHLRGSGLGGRNQELALGAAEGLAGIHHAAIISAGSDGTDGPTDAAGGYVDGDSFSQLCSAGFPPSQALADNDAYHALASVDGLVKTGPTGTNVNDIAVALLNSGTRGHPQGEDHPL